MAYRIKPFGYVSKDNDVALQSAEGIFDVSHPDVAELIKHISHKNSSIIRNIDSLLETFRLNNISDEVINYLVNDIGILDKFEGAIPRVSIFHSQKNLQPCVTQVYPDWNIDNIENFPGKSSVDFAVCVIDIARFDTILNTLDEVDENIAISFLVPVKDKIILTPFWRKKTACPCPSCHLDFMTESVFFNPRNTVLSLSEVAQHLFTSGYESFPTINYTLGDLLFVFRYVYLRLEIASGVANPSSSIHTDPYACSVFNIETLERSEIRVPFSPRCDCIHSLSSPNLSHA